MKNNDWAKPHERIDDLHRNGYHILQDPSQFCFGIDAVLLSGFVRIKPGENTLDLGTGTGILPILMAGRTPGEHFTGLEIQPEMAEMAERSVAMNGLSEKITIHTGDIRAAADRYPLASFDVITSNPPYMPPHGGLKNPDSAKAIARHEILCTFSDIALTAGKLLRTGGRLYIVHRPQRLTELLVTLREHGLEPKCLRFVHSYLEQEPTMVLLEAIRGGRPMVRVLPPLVIYAPDGEYTEEVRRIYYD